MSNTTLTGAIVLRWRNRNILDIDGTNIYRSESPMDKENLPEPYDFVEGSDSMYVDHNTELFKQYFYKIGVVKGDEELITDGQLNMVSGFGMVEEKDFDTQAEVYTLKIPNNTDNEDIEHDVAVFTLKAETINGETE